MSILLHGDCIELLDTLDDHSVDFIYCDFPYATERFGTCTSCEWDKPIDLEKWWGKILKKKKINTPIFMSCNVKLGCELIRTAPKKCPFRYDLIWVKSTPCGFLSAKKMPMRKHELIYVFYEKLPLYDLSSHTHTFTKERDTAQKNGKIYEGKGNKKIMEGGYSPPLPVSVIKGENNTYNTEGRNKPITREPAGKYNPPLPTSLLEVKSTRGSHSTEKPTELIKWLLKYYSKEGDVVLDCTMGSGSTGVACKEMNRNFIGFELNPEIYEVAVNRIEG
jgi:site-specific DNA-methyltransferase (adenine-specific)